MQDPLFSEESSHRIPDEWRRAYLKRPQDRLALDVTHAFDRLWAMEREKDKLLESLNAAKNRLRVESWKVWTLTLLITGEGAVIGWLVKEFLGRFK